MEKTVQQTHERIEIPVDSEKEIDIANKMSNIENDTMMVNVTNKLPAKSKPSPLNEMRIELSDVCTLKQIRLSSTMEALGKEIFRPDAISEKKASFITSRPFSWLEAVRTYTESGNLKTRCEYSTKKEKSQDKISIIKIRVCFDGNKEAMISINCGTGLFSVKNTAVEEWIKKEFPKLQSSLKSTEVLLSDEASPNIPEKDITQDTSGDETVPADAGKNDSSAKTIKSSGKNAKNSSPEIVKIWTSWNDIWKSVSDVQASELWNNTEQIRTAVTSIESSLSTLSTRLSESIELSNDRFTKQENRIKDMDKLLDDKVSLFAKTLEDDFNKRIERLVRGTNDKVFHLKQQINSCRDDITGLAAKETASPDPNAGLCHRIDELTTRVDNINVEELKKDFTKLSDDTHIDFASLSVLERSVEKMQKESKDNDKETFSKFQKLQVQANRNQETLEVQSAEINALVRSSVQPDTDTFITPLQPGSNKDSVSSEDSGTQTKRVYTEEVIPESEVKMPEIAEAAEENKTPSHMAIKDDSTELLFVIDSNARYLNFRQLWTMKGTEILRCGTMFDVYNCLKGINKEYTNLKYFFLSVGTNDLEVKTPHQLFTSINQLVHKLNEVYPDLKFILSEVTPRMDHIDGRVKEANELLDQYARCHDNVFLVKNSNLRNPDNFFADGKHLKHAIIPRFASNIKRALRAAYGIKFDRRNHHQYPQQQQQQYREQPRRDLYENNRDFQQSFPASTEVIMQMLRRITQAFGYCGT